MPQTHYSPNSVPRRLQRPETSTTLRSVRQDKPRAPRARAASDQPGSVENMTRARQTDTNSFRSQNPIKKHSNKRRKKKVSIWLDPPEVAMLVGKAKSAGLSISATGAAFLKRGMQAELDMQYSATLKPIIETLIRNELRRYFSRMILFLARITMSLDVIKGLVKWLARRIAGVTKEQLDMAEERSRTDARLNLIKRTPQLEAVSKELEQTLMEGII